MKHTFSHSVSVGEQLRFSFAIPFSKQHQDYKMKIQKSDLTTVMAKGYGEKNFWRRIKRTL
jgi:hypothetical protein